MENDFKPDCKADGIEIQRINTSSSARGLIMPNNIPITKIPDRFEIEKKPAINHELGKDPIVKHEIKSIVKVESNNNSRAVQNPPVDLDQKYFRLGLLIQCIIILKILLFSVCLFRIQLLGLAIIADFFGEIAVCHMKKKALKIYMVILCGSFAAKIFGITNLVENSKDSEYFNLLFGILVGAQVLESIQGILLGFFSYHIFKMNESKIDALYDKNCFCCRSKPGVQPF